MVGCVSDLNHISMIINIPWLNKLFHFFLPKCTLECKYKGQMTNELEFRSQRKIQKGKCQSEKNPSLWLMGQLLPSRSKGSSITQGV